MSVTNSTRHKRGRSSSEEQAPAPMIVSGDAASEGNPSPPVPCSRTKLELKGLLYEAQTKEVSWDEHFFKDGHDSEWERVYGSHPTAPPETIRCVRCGLTIDEHRKNQELSPQETIAKIINNNDSQWTRPTPRQKNIHRSVQHHWDPQKLFAFPGPLPKCSDLGGDERNTAIGIGNAFGTGKTEAALSGAEATVEREPNCKVAYASFGNGYYDPKVAETTKEPEKYSGLWLFAAKNTTRLAQDGTIETNPQLFLELILTHLDHPGWPLPKYVKEACSELIIIFDEIQQFNFTALEKFVEGKVLPTRVRMTLLVGAFSPSFGFASGNRLTDCKFPPASEADMTSIFQDHLGATVEVNGVKLPALFGSIVRPIVNSSGSDIFTNHDPFSACRSFFQTIYTNDTPGKIVRAVLGSRPVKKKPLQTIFVENTTSLGAATLWAIGNEHVPTHYQVSMPPLLISSGNFELLDAADSMTVTTVKSVLEDFVKPNWSQFEALSGIAPALRLVSLTQTELEFDMRDSASGIELTPLQAVFGHATCNPEMKELLKARVPQNLKLKWVHGGNDIDKVNFSEIAQPDSVVVVQMDHDQNSPFDNFVIVPLEKQRLPYLVLCTDGKYSEEKTRSLSREKDIDPKVENHSKIGEQLKEHASAVVIISNKTFTGKHPESDVPVAICARKTLEQVFGAPLVPPKCAS